MLTVELPTGLFLIGDTTCYRLCEIKKTKKTEAGVMVTLGYYSDITSVVVAALDYGIRTSDFTTLLEIKEFIQEFRVFVEENLSPNNIKKERGDADASVKSGK